MSAWEARAMKSLALVVLAATAAVADPKPPGKLVDIGGRRLHLYCIGSGSPTVIVEAGSSSFSIDFALVQPAIAKLVQVCTYDRAGMAWSDPGPTQATVEQTMDDLHLLLTKAAIRPPYVILGASLGGLFARSYQRRYPAEVVGVVMDDPASDEGLRFLVNGKDKESYDMTAAEMREVGREYLRKPPPPPELPTKLDPPDDRLPVALHAAELWAARKYFTDRDLTSLVMVTNESYRQEFIALRAERLQRPHPLGALPLVVIGRNETDERRKQLVDLAALSTAGKLVIAKDSGHEIHVEKPEVVIDAVREVVMAVRSR